MNDSIDAYQFFESVLLRCIGTELEVENVALVAGGDINTAVCLDCEAGQFFLKFREGADSSVFEAEAKGLELLESSGQIATPSVIGHGQLDGYGFLMLEFIDTSLPKHNYWVQLGTHLAGLHSIVGKSSGLAQDNYLGTLQQTNEPNDYWPTFWAQQRLLPLAGKALVEDLLPLDLFKRLEKLYDLLPDLLPAIGNSLLHGDLWNGNVMPDGKGTPVVFDPAVYYGHREVDLAMTRLFGGFPTQFYSAYQEAMPLESGWTERMEIYTLYPLLAHVNIFGTAYLPGIEKVLNKFGV